MVARERCAAIRITYVLARYGLSRTYCSTADPIAHWPARRSTDAPRPGVESIRGVGGDARCSASRRFETRECTDRDF
eukprot:3556188-Prymnesium_polylepis.1